MMTNRQISRRELMRHSAAALLAAGLWPGALRAQEAAAAPELEFLCVNDLHFIDDNCIPFFQKMITKMREASPASRLLLVVGDLAQDGKPNELAGVRDVLTTLGITTRVVMGNHDWTTQTERNVWNQTWPDSINYTFEHGGWQFVGLDSSEGVKYQNTSIQKETLDWVDSTLPKLDRRRPMVLFTHFPFGPQVKYRPANVDALLERFREFNLRAVFNGHFHGYTERTRGDTVITTNRCCSFRRDNHDGTAEKGFFVVRARDGRLTREFIEVVRQAPRS
jgi:3',5'-cyclic AMP phosphodiesterase CpdA